MLNKIPQTIDIKYQNIRKEREIPKSDDYYLLTTNTMSYLMMKHCKHFL